MKILFEKIVRLRNPAFKFDAALSSSEIFYFSFRQLVSLLRGFKLLLRFKNPKRMMLGKGVQFFNIHKMLWGQYLKMGDHVYISALGRLGITMGNNVGIGAYSRVVVATTLDQAGEYIAIGNHVGIGEFAYLGGAGGLSIGNDCIIGQYFSCHPENHRFTDMSKPIRLQGVTRSGISIGKNCWIGSKVTVLDGVTLGNGCVVAAGAVVNKSFPDNCIIGGVPAKLLRMRGEEATLKNMYPKIYLS